MEHQHSLSKSVISSWLSILAVPFWPQLQRISRVIYTLHSSSLDTTLLHILLKRYSHLSLSLPPLLHPPFPFAFCFWLQHVHFVWPLWCSVFWNGLLLILLWCKGRFCLLWMLQQCSDFFCMVKGVGIFWEGTSLGVFVIYECLILLPFIVVVLTELTLQYLNHVWHVWTSWTTV
jgi:hypothetical protein